MMSMSIENLQICSQLSSGACMNSSKSGGHKSINQGQLVQN